MADRAISAGGNIYSIPSGASFLRILAQALVEGRLIDGFRPLDDPLAMTSATVYLPTRRAARAFGEAIREASGRPAMLLPAIHALGDADEEELFFASFETGEALPAAIGRTTRRLYLTRLVQRFAEAGRGGGGDGATTPSAGEAAMLAGDLARVIDQLATEEIEWSEIVAYAGRESDGAPWADWWKQTLEFLAIVGEYWPAQLAETGSLDPARRRRALLDLRCHQYRENVTRGPVIAAGSTGSIPATARLINAIASLEQGAVVLPGVDLEIADDLFERLADGKTCGKDPTLAAHPQAGLVQLLTSLVLRPRDVQPLCGVPDRLAARETLVRRAMLPAADTDIWSRPLPDVEQATAAITVVDDAHNEREEALVVAIALREILEDENRSAALVTPDRNLARRVAAELRRFGIEIDDSAGRPLTSTPAFEFADALLAVALGSAGPEIHASLIKHPFLLTGRRPRDRKVARFFELAVLRDALLPPSAGSMADAVRKAQQRISRLKHRPAHLVGMDEPLWRSLIEFGELLDSGLEELAALNARGKTVAVRELAAALVRAIGSLAPSSSSFHDDEAGGALLELLEEMAFATGTGLAVEPGEFPSLLHALASDITIRDLRGTHARLSIWGPLEARLQRVDRVILGGLNEGVWPAADRDDPFLNRTMKSALGLAQPERWLGLAAHDFQQLSGHDEVFYTRSARRDGTPTVASRFLQRLLTAAGDAAAEKMRERGQRYKSLASQIDASEAGAQWIERPNPKPPVSLRPKKLSITEIETWIRDPYAIYARHILALRPLPPLLAQADPMLRGSIYHAVLDLYVRQSGNSQPSFALLEETAQNIFRQLDLPAEARASWLPRFLEVGRQFIKWEQERRPLIAESRTEVRGEMVVGVEGFRLTGRADRIDLMRDGAIAIIDYKTGGTPSIKQARTLSPQLALEAAMAKAGAFHLPTHVHVGSLAYVRLRPGGNWKIDEICEGSGAPSPEKLAENALAQLRDLISAFEEIDQGYVSRRAPLLEAQVSGDYDHLARVREWTIGEEAEEDAV